MIRRCLALAALVLVMPSLASCSSDRVTTAPPDQGTPIVAAKLVFATQPGGATAGTPFTTQPVIEAQDPSGNVATTFTGPVLIFIGIGGGSSQLCCNVTVNAVNGVASFSGLRIDVAGTYTLRVSSGSLVTAQSGVFDVTP
jgi:hypothetical protein